MSLSMHFCSDKFTGAGCTSNRPAMRLHERVNQDTTRTVRRVEGGTHATFAQSLSKKEAICMS